MVAQTQSTVLVEAGPDGIIRKAARVEVLKRLRDLPPAVPSGPSKDAHAEACMARYTATLEAVGMDYVLLGELKFGPWQRAVSPAVVKRLRDDFDPELIKPLVVSRRADGTEYVLDGQHRVVALRRLGFPPETPIGAMIHTGLTPQREATLFLLLNKDRHVGPTDRFKARLIAGEAPALALQRVFDAVPVAVRYTGGDQPTNISAVEAAEEVYAAAGANAAGEGALEQTLRCCIRGWDFDRRNTDGRLVRAMGAVVLIGGRGFSLEHMVSRIKSMRLDIDSLFQRASTKDHDNLVPAMTSVLAFDVYQPGARGTARLQLAPKTPLEQLRLRFLRVGETAPEA